MGIEINRARVENGEVRCELVFPNVGSFVRSLNEVLRIEAEAFAPVEPTAPYAGPHRSHAEAVYAAKRAAAQQATGRCITAYVPSRRTDPECSTLGGQPLPGGYLMADTEEPPLRAFTADEYKVGGTD